MLAELEADIVDVGGDESVDPGDPVEPVGDALGEPARGVLDLTRGPDPGRDVARVPGRQVAPARVAELTAKGLNPAEVANALRCSERTVYRMQSVARGA